MLEDGAIGFGCRSKVGQLYLAFGHPDSVAQDACVEVGTDSLATVFLLPLIVTGA